MDAQDRPRWCAATRINEATLEVQGPPLAGRQVDKIHTDDTPVPVFEPGNGKTKTGRIWTYVRDHRLAGSRDAPAAWFAYSPSRSGEHPLAHLKGFKGTLQADAFAGYDRSMRAVPCVKLGV